MKFSTLFLFSLLICSLSFSQDEIKILTGGASFYAKKFEGRKTANGEWFSNSDMTCASRTLKFHTFLKVKNLKNDLATIVRVNDRGPYAKKRIIDLSEQAARIIGTYQQGTTKVEIEIIKPPVLTVELDSIFKTTQVSDCLGNAVKITEYTISIWRTRDLEHAILLGNLLYEQEYVHAIFIGKKIVKGRPIYHLIVSNIETGNEAKTIKDFWERKGFMKVQLFEKF